MADSGRAVADPKRLATRPPAAAEPTTDPDEALEPGPQGGEAVSRHAALLGDPRLISAFSPQQRVQLVRHLQRGYGNAHVARVMSQFHGSAPTPVLRKGVPEGAATARDGSGENPGERGNETESEAPSAIATKGFAVPLDGGPGAGATVARVIQRAVADVPTAPAGAGPADSPGLQKVLGEVKQSAQKAEAHDSTDRLTKQAQAAAPTPDNDTTSRARFQQTATMSAAPAARPNTNSFLALLRSKLEEIAPKNNQEVKDFAKSGKANQVQGVLTQQVQAQQQQAQAPITNAANAPPPVGQVAPRQAAPPPPPPQAAPLPPIQADQAVPQPAPDPGPALAQQTSDAEKQMTDAKITPEQLQKANDPRFSAVIQARDDMHASAATAPAQFKGKQQDILAKTEAGAKGDANAAQQHLQDAHTQALAGAHGQQQATMSRDAQERKAVADTIQQKFDALKTKVDAKLNEIGPAADQLFTEGEKAARQAFEDEVDHETLKHNLLHPIDSLVGWATGYDPDLRQIWETARQHYLTALDGVLVKVADRVEQGLKEAKDLIAQGHDEIAKYVAGLDPKLRESGEQAEQALSAKFDELQHSVDAKKEELAKQLVQRYQAAQKEIDDRMKELEESHRGAITGFLDKLAAVKKAIDEFKQRLQGVVTNAEETLDLIIKDPIAFLGHLLDALKQGFSQFSANILSHLKKGLMEWLFGAIAKTGIQLPESFDLKGIVMLVLQVLGVTWPKIKGKITKIIGPRAMTVIEKIVDYVSALLNGGIEGLWEKIKEDLSGLKDMVIGAIRDWVITTVVKEAIQKLISMSNPVGAIVEAVHEIYKTVMFFISKADQIMGLVETIVRSVSNIARGDIGTAANWVEQAMGAAIPVILGFLADLLGLGDIADTIQGLIKKAQDYVDKAIDAALAKIVEVAKSLFGGKDDDKDDDKKSGDPELDAAREEAEGLLQADDATPDGIREKLPAIESKHQLTSAELKQEGDEFYVVVQRMAENTDKKKFPVYKPPHPRHFLNRITASSWPKDANTVIEPGVDVDGDVDAINAGKAARSGNTFAINGRTYGTEDGDRLYPISGTDFHELDRGSYKLLQLFIRYGDPDAPEVMIRIEKEGYSHEQLGLALQMWGMRK